MPRHKFPKGNEFWKARASTGPDKIFSTPQALWDAAQEYFQWVRDNPIYEQRLVTYLGDYQRVDVPKMRAMTIYGLCGFLGVTSKTWYLYKDYEGYQDVCAAIDETIRQQKIEGAMANQLNQLVVVRELGLKDKKELSGDQNAPISTVRMNASEYAAVRDQMLKEDDC